MSFPDLHNNLAMDRPVEPLLNYVNHIISIIRRSQIENIQM